MTKIVVRSMTNPEAAYTVDTDQLTCSCPAFIYGYTIPCKHMKAMPELDGKMDHLGKNNGVDLEFAEPLEKALKKTGLFSIGHSNHEMGYFLSLLAKHKITTLVDVRRSPWSKWQPHFNRPILGNAVRGAGLRYFYGGKHLGGHDLSVEDPEFIEKMNKVMAMSAKERVVMMCAEKDPMLCHRAVKLMAHVIWNTNPDDLGSLNHIMADGSLLTAERLHQKQKKSKKSIWHEYGGTYVC